MINSLIYESIDRKMINSLNYLTSRAVITLENSGIRDNDIGLDFGRLFDGQTVCHLSNYRIAVSRKPYKRYYKWLMNTLRYHSPTRLVEGLNVSKAKIYKN